MVAVQLGGVRNGYIPSNSSHLPLFEIGVAVAPLRPFVRRVRDAQLRITMDARFRHDVALLPPVRRNSTYVVVKALDVMLGSHSAMVELLGDAADTVAFAPDVPVQVQGMGTDLGAGAALNVTRGVLAVLCRSLHVFDVIRQAPGAGAGAGAAASPGPSPSPSTDVDDETHADTDTVAGTGAGTGVGTGAGAGTGEARPAVLSDRPIPRRIRVVLVDSFATSQVDGQRQLFAQQRLGLPASGRQHRFEPVEYLVLRAVRILQQEPLMRLLAAQRRDNGSSDGGRGGGGGGGGGGARAGRIVQMNITVPRDARPNSTDFAGIARLFKGLYARMHRDGLDWTSAADALPLPRAWRRALAALVAYLSRFDVVVLGNRNNQIDEYVSVAAALAGVPVRLMELPLVQPAVRTVDGYIAPSSFVCNHDTVRAAARPCYLVAPGVDVRRWRRQSGASASASTRSGPGPAPASAETVAFVGRLDPEKSPALFVRAAALVRRRRPSARFVLIGDGDLRPALEMLAEALGLGSRGQGSGRGALRFLGARFHDELPGLLAGVAAVCLPSQWEETFGLTNIEAMAMGLPIISYGTGGQGAYVRHGENALVPAAPTAESLADAMLAVLANRTLARRLGDGGRALVRSTYTLETMLGGYAGLYERLVLERLGGGGGGNGGGGSNGVPEELCGGEEPRSSAALAARLVRSGEVRSVIVRRAVERTDRVVVVDRLPPGADAFAPCKAQRVVVDIARGAGPGAAPANASVPVPTPTPLHAPAPYIIALALEALLPHIARPFAEVLEVGVGSGAAFAAVAARAAQLLRGRHDSIGARVFSTDRRAAVVRLTAAALEAHGDADLLREGWLQLGEASAPPPHMRFDAIFVGGGVPAVPESLLGRLKPDGVMVVPVGPPGAVLRLLLVEGTRCVARAEQQVAQGFCTAHESFDVTVLRDGVLCDPLPESALDDLGLGVQTRAELEPWQWH
eukprot:g1758.t1